ncbi:MAG: hypothetical protein GY820_20175, partial [Gammaproteobacteria bacterium]|nr:hypothetical protein [Gammaproteobacteria bacterium]
VLNKKGELTVPEADLDYWEETNRTYSGAPIVKNLPAKEQARYESQWWTDTIENAKETALTPGRQFYETFLDMRRRHGNVPACAMLLMHQCRENKGIEVVVSEEDFQKVLLSKRDLEKQQKKKKQPLFSPSGQQVQRQLGKTTQRAPRKKKVAASPAKQPVKGVQYTAKVSVKTFPVGGTPMDLTTAKGDTADESMKGATDSTSAGTTITRYTTSTQQSGSENTMEVDHSRPGTSASSGSVSASSSKPVSEVTEAQLLGEEEMEGVEEQPDQSKKSEEGEKEEGKKEEEGQKKRSEEERLALADSDDQLASLEKERREVDDEKERLEEEQRLLLQLSELEEREQSLRAQRLQLDEDDQERKQNLL